MVRDLEHLLVELGGDDEPHGRVAPGALRVGWRLNSRTESDFERVAKIPNPLPDRPRQTGTPSPPPRTTPTGRSRTFPLLGWVRSTTSRPTTTKKDQRARLSVIALEDRAVPTVVTLTKVSDTAENGTNGLFRFTRSPVTSDPLYLSFTVDNTTADGSATPGTDYQQFTGGIPVIPPNQATLDLPVRPRSDNEFEDTETIQVTLRPSSGGTTTTYSVGGTPTQVMNLTDDPPRVTASAVWRQVGNEIGRVTLTRSGGDVSRELEVWVEPTGTVVDNEGGRTVPVVFAARVRMSPGQSTVELAIQDNTASVEVLAPYISGATFVGGPLGNRVQTVINELSAGPNAGAEFEAGVANIPLPLTFQEFRLRDRITRGLIEDPELFGNAANIASARRVAGDKLTLFAVDWRTVSRELAPTFRGDASLFAGVVAGAGSLKFDQQLRQWCLDLGSDDFRTRERATSAIRALIDQAINRADLVRMTLVQDRLRATIRQGTPEAGRRASDLIKRLTSAGALKYFLKFKVEAMAAVAGVPVLAEYP
ncbi:MAG: hypothetical protein K2X87_00955 [Gemmataceae bacterium]|nr:hypothetical protein [Gemmataceae bacterium]